MKPDPDMPRSVVSVRSEPLTSSRTISGPGKIDTFETRFVQLNPLHSGFLI
jgi:hypothetical protein